MAFAVAWLPCTGPTLGAILTAASTESTVGQGGVLLAFYSLGLAVPFVLSALAFTTFSGVFRFFRDHYRAITLISGLVLIVMGVLLYTNELTRLNAEALRPDGRPRHQLLQRDLTVSAGRGARTLAATPTATRQTSTTSPRPTFRPSSSASPPIAGGPARKPR